MTEWAILAAVVALVAAYIAWPRAVDLEPLSHPDFDELRGEREDLLQELREIDDDAAAGLITPEDRATARRELGPRLRRVTEELRSQGRLADRP